MSPFYTKDDSRSVRKRAFMYSFIIETGLDKPPIDYHLKSTHLHETCQQRLQEEVFRKLFEICASNCSVFYRTIL